MEEQNESVAVKEPMEEDRIDHIAIDQFRALGYEGRLPDVLVDTYLAFKRRKDHIHPGTLSPEGVVSVLFFAGMIDKETNSG